MIEKIAFIYYQSDSKSNGGIRSMLQIIDGLNEFDIIGISNKNEFASVFSSFKKVNYHPNKSIIQKAKLALLLSIYLLKQKIRVVHVNDIGMFYLLPIILLFPGIKVVLNIRSVKRSYSVKWLIVNLASSIVVLSEDMRLKLLDRLPFILPNKVTHIYSAVELRGDKPLLLSQKQNRIIYPAVFGERKNQKGFLENFDFTTLPEGVIVMCIGDMTDKEYVSACNEVVRKRGIGNCVELLPHNSNIYELMRTSLICLVISDREGMARVMIESLAAGTPCVSFDLPSAREILDKVDTRLVIPHRDYNKLSEVLNSIINDRNYDGLAFKSYSKAKELFQIQNMQNSYKKIYEK